MKTKQIVLAAAFALATLSGFAAGNDVKVIAHRGYWTAPGSARIRCGASKLGSGPGGSFEESTTAGRGALLSVTQSTQGACLLWPPAFGHLIAPGE